MKLLNKLTVKTVCGDLRKVAAEYEDGEDVIVMTVWGHANDKKPGTNTQANGEESHFVKFFGKCAAWPGLQGVGEQCRAGVAILPDIPTTLLDAMVRSFAELVDKKGQYRMEEKDARKLVAEQDVQYGFQIGITTDASAIRGYSYFAAPLMEPVGKDSLDEMGDMLTEAASELVSKRKRLPAPDAPAGNGRRKKKATTKKKAKAKRKAKASA